MNYDYSFITDELLDKFHKYHRLTNYIAASQLYLKDNFQLKEKLKKEHIKKRILGHWGTVPGINLVYIALNNLIQRHNQEMMLVVGPGHGYPALLANLYVEGTLGEFYPEYKWSKNGFENLIKKFSWPGGFPSHANPETPGVILEGGELGYSLSTSFGAAFDNPDLIVACAVGDGESETGPTATAWHSNKYLNPKTSGAVLPIVHVNKYKISGPTIYGSMSNQELLDLFRGYGYEPIIVEENNIYHDILKEFEYAFQKIKQIQYMARVQNIIDKPRWPVIILKNKKGFSGPGFLKGEMVEDSFRSHGIPLENPINDKDEFKILNEWLNSYKVNELINSKCEPIKEIQDLLPKRGLRLGNSKYANNSVEHKLNLPQPEKFKVKVGSIESSLNQAGKFLRDIVKLNPTTFRVMSPDETESNKIHALFETTKRGYIWPVPKGSENISNDGRVMEILSEHTLQGWMEGYILTGRHAIFISYEAFMMIIASMVDQYSKFLKQSQSISWRKPVPSMNLVLTSTSWRQDHNGFSHQNPGFISSVLNDYTNLIRVHFPADANTIIATLEESFSEKNRINVIVADKRPLEQYLSMKDAKQQVKDGIMIWDNYGNKSESPDVVFAASGDHPTQESIAATRILKKIMPEIKTRFVSVSELTCFGIGDNRNSTNLNDKSFNKIFSEDKPIIFSYYGYPEDIKSLIFNHSSSQRMSIHGYTENGTTTTPFDMQVLNKSDRFSLAIEALEKAKLPAKLLTKKVKNIEHLNKILNKHRKYIKDNGVDIDEVENFNKYFG